MLTIGSVNDKKLVKNYQQKDRSENITYFNPTQKSTFNT